MIAALLLAAALPPSVSQPQDWPATTLADARALHDDIRANHPGPVNAVDPEFVAREMAAYARLQRRARAVRGITGYRFAVKKYIASFDDGHVQFWIEDNEALPAANWPGFLTGFDALGVQRVMTRNDDAPVPLGAELKRCDGVPAAKLAARDVGAFEGRWTLPATRVRQGGDVLADWGNPFVRRPAACDFKVGGVTRRVPLRWRPIAGKDLEDRVSAISGILKGPIGAERLPDGTRWCRLSSFDGDPAGETARALVPLIAGMRADRAALARAPAIVLDLRGNGGGSACLDAVDTWRALGAIQVGRETSADTLYMDIRRGKLPSGLAGYAVPMKVYRGRSRRSNVPWTPVHRFEGDLTDTPAVERWVTGLPEQRR